MMKTTWKKGISYLMVLVFVLTVIGTSVTPADAATKYVKKYTKTITLERGYEYNLPIKMKQNANIKITAQLQTKGDYLEVVCFPKDGNGEAISTTGTGGSLGINAYDPEDTWLVPKVVMNMKAPKGNSSYLYMYIVGDSEFEGNSVDVKITITCPKKAMSIGKIKKIA